MKLTLSKTLLLLGILTVGMVLNVPHADAVSSEWIKQEPISIRLVVSSTSTDRYEGIVDVALEKDWHTYWKAPGDAGLPPRFDWSKSVNVENIDIKFPVPQRFKEHEYTTFGYSDSVRFPFDFSRESNDRPVHLDLSLTLMVCKDICMPRQVDLSVAIPDQIPGSENAVIDQAKAFLPSLKNISELEMRNAIISEQSIAIGVYAEHGIENTDVFVAIEGLGLAKKPRLKPNVQDKRQGVIVVDKPDHIDDLNIYTQGKTVEVIVQDLKADRAIQNFIRIPQDNT